MLHKILFKALAVFEGFASINGVFIWSCFTGTVYIDLIAYIIACTHILRWVEQNLELAVEWYIYLVVVVSTSTLQYRF